MKPYNPQEIEKKWAAAVQCPPSSTKHAQSKVYVLYAFPYPSGSGLHVGHVEPMTALDMVVRFLRMNGSEVFFPMGWDAFGLPAENYALKTGVHPSITTMEAIDTFRRQIREIGISFDWKTEIATCHPGYYKWTQWIFIKLFEAGLAYRDMGWVNWCPSCKTVLANEQVVEGKCERCGTAVVQKELEQWKFRMTAYQDELLSGLDQVDWPKATKLQQENWIGKSEGTIVRFQMPDTAVTIECFTTRLDTIHGVTFVVISPEKFAEYTLMDQVSPEQREAVEAYLERASHKTEEERRVGEKAKTGVDTGIKLLHPLSGDEIPLWIADYVLAGYGTGVVMGVPSLDERDAAFAKKFGLPLKEIELLTPAACEQLLDEKPEVFSKKTLYKLRDWLISRQRYWGAPIPMTLCETCGWQAVPEDQLPVRLPEVPDFSPTDDGSSPIEKASDDWKYTTCSKCGGQAKREVDTMDTFVDSSWYYLRYTDPRNEHQIFDKERAARLLPVDHYLIGPEHIVLHLLYSRFFTKFLRDQGYLAFDEPFMTMRHQGMILGPDGKKMSKSKGNVINPDDIIQRYGADTLRLYEMFMGPLDADKAWNMNSVAGVYRFISRVYALFQKNLDLVVRTAESAGAPDPLVNETLRRKLHWAIAKLTKDIPEYKLNTSIAALMELTNIWSESVAHGRGFDREDLSVVCRLFAPFAPFVAEELWRMLGGDASVHEQAWPTYDQSLLVSATVEIAVSLNGKVRLRIPLDTEVALDKNQLAKEVLNSPEVISILEGRQPQQVIAVPSRLVNIVV